MKSLGIQKVGGFTSAPLVIITLDGSCIRDLLGSLAH